MAPGRPFVPLAQNTIPVRLRNARNPRKKKTGTAEKKTPLGCPNDPMGPNSPIGEVEEITALLFFKKHTLNLEITINKAN